MVIAHTTTPSTSSSFNSGKTPLLADETSLMMNCDEDGSGAKSNNQSQQQQAQKKTPRKLRLADEEEEIIKHMEQIEFRKVVEQQLAHINAEELSPLPECSTSTAYQLPNQECHPNERLMMIMLQYQSFRSYNQYSEDETKQKEQIEKQKASRFELMKKKRAIRREKRKCFKLRKRGLEEIQSSSSNSSSTCDSDRMNAMMMMGVDDEDEFDYQDDEEGSLDADEIEGVMFKRQRSMSDVSSTDGSNYAYSCYGAPSSPSHKMDDEEVDIGYLDSLLPSPMTHLHHSSLFPQSTTSSNTMVGIQQEPPMMFNHMSSATHPSANIPSSSSAAVSHPSFSSYLANNTTVNSNHTSFSDQLFNMSNNGGHHHQIIESSDPMTTTTTTSSLIATSHHLNNNHVNHHHYHSSSSQQQPSSSDNSSSIMNQLHSSNTSRFTPSHLHTASQYNNEIPSHQHPLQTTTTANPINHTSTVDSQHHMIYATPSPQQQQQSHVVVMNHHAIHPTTFTTSMSALQANSY